MRLLLDTHTLLWYILGTSQVSPKALALLRDPKNTKFVSPASFWELAIKISIGKYALQQPFQAFMEQGIQKTGFAILPIQIAHTAVLATPPFHHKDPSDRMLIAQAMVEQMDIVSADPDFDAYPVTRLW